jgi:indole-3-glycerol phosphate synthase
MKTLAADHVLTRLVKASRERLEDTRLRVPEAIVRKMARVAAEVPSFREAIAGPHRIRIIAEIKKASPSAGVLVPDLDVRSLARAYRDSGASAISVVTEERFFQGNLGWIRVAQKESGLPVLRKDFLFDPYQIAETRAAGASAVLLIVAMLDAVELSNLLDAAGEFGLDALVEVHDEAELDEALLAGAGIIGVNNRDLRTFEVDLETSMRLGGQIPEAALFVAESGIRNRSDLDRLRGAGADAFLIGESLLSSGDPGFRLGAFL